MQSGKIVNLRGKFPDKFQKYSRTERHDILSLHKKFTELSLDSHVHMINRTFQTSVREIDSQNDKCVPAFRSLQFTKK